MHNYMSLLTLLAASEVMGMGAWKDGSPDSSAFPVSSHGVNGISS
jgi:hypothetical protein